MTEKQKQFLSKIQKNRQYSAGTLKPELRIANALVMKGLMKKFENTHGITVWTRGDK